METSRRKVHRKNVKALLVAVYHLILLVFEKCLKSVTSEQKTTFSVKALILGIFCSVLTVQHKNGLTVSCNLLIMI